MIRIPTALALLLATLALASCGGDDGEPIPSGRAERLEGLLQDVQRQTDAGACNQLQETTIPRLDREARRLPNSVSADTRETIEDGVAHLRDLAEDECAEDSRQDDTTTEETTTSETTTPTETTPTAPETTTTEEPTTTDEPTTTQTEPPPTEPEPPDDPGNGNGNGGASPGEGGTGGTPPGLERKGGKKDKGDKK